MKSGRDEDECVFKSKMEMMSLMVVCLLGGLLETEATSVTGESGREVRITCSHANAFSNIKYFCKGRCNDKDVLIRSSEKKRNSKYSISDEGNTFYVTISHLTYDDSGTYWCGIERVGVDTFNKVILTVVEGNAENSDGSLESILNGVKMTSKMLGYIGAGLGVVLLALAAALLIFFRHRNRDARRSSGKVPDTVYAMPLSEKQEERRVAQDQETSRRPADNIYSDIKVSSESQLEPDSLCYSTVSFRNRTDCSAVTSDTVTYSTINYTPAEDESKVYGNV